MNKKTFTQIALSLCVGLILCPAAHAANSISCNRSLAISDSSQINSSVRRQVYYSALNQKNHYTLAVQNTSEAESLLDISFFESQAFNNLTKEKNSTLRFDYSTSTAIEKTTYVQHCFKDALRLKLEAVSVWNNAFSNYSEYLIFHNEGQILQQTTFLSSNMSFQLFNLLDDGGAVIEQYILFEDSATAYTLHVISADCSAIPQDFIQSILDDFSNSQFNKISTTDRLNHFIL